MIRFTAGLVPSGSLQAREVINKTVINNVTHTHLAVTITRHFYRATISTAHTQNAAGVRSKPPKPLGLRQVEHTWILKADCLT